MEVVVKEWQVEAMGGSLSEMSIGAASLSQPPIAQLGCDTPARFIVLRPCQFMFCALPVGAPSR